MQINMDLDRDKAISDNEPLMDLLEEVEKQIGNPKKKRVLTEFEETVTGDGRAIKITYNVHTLGFARGPETCTFFADRDYHLKTIIRK